MAEKNLPREIERIKIDWHDAFEHMQRYYESESFNSFKIVYNAYTGYQFKNPALIFPVEREMLFSTSNQHIKFDYYCYADIADALRRLYEKERTACRSYI